MTRYEVSMEAKVDHYITVEANSPEEAALLALQRTKHTLEVTMRPTFLDEKARANETGELRYELLGVCDRCKKAILSDYKNPSDDWLYASTDEGDGMLCRPCAKGPIESLAELSTGD